MCFVLLFAETVSEGGGGGGEKEDVEGVPSAERADREVGATVSILHAVVSFTLPILKILHQLGDSLSNISLATNTIRMTLLVNRI